MSVATVSPSDFAVYPSSQQESFLRDVVNGLSCRQKKLKAKYFYDQQGSHYFDQICDLAEYYIYKTELKILPIVAAELAQTIDDALHVVEFGAGSVHKIKPLLQTIPNIKKFTAIDISGDHLQTSCSDLQAAFPDIEVKALVGDFTQPINIANRSLKLMGFFPGSTIGNFTPVEAKQFLQNAANSLGSDAYFLVGVDTKKSPETLHNAYNDQLGITAKFNLNILHRINQELQSNIDVKKFEHYAYYNAPEGRIEMHLVSLGDQRCVIDNQEIRFTRGESIHTENSYKYTPEEFTQLAQQAGWHCQNQWLAENDMFSMYLLRTP